jgi:hypothetical protein
MHKLILSIVFLLALIVVVVPKDCVQVNSNDLTFCKGNLPFDWKAFRGYNFPIQDSLANGIYQLRTSASNSTITASCDKALRVLFCKAMMPTCTFSYQYISIPLCQSICDDIMAGDCKNSNVDISGFCYPTTFPNCYDGKIMSSSGALKGSVVLSVVLFIATMLI